MNPLLSKKAILLYSVLRCGPNSHVTTLVDLNVDYIRAAADRTILDVLLVFARRQVHGEPGSTLRHITEEPKGFA